MDEPPAVPAARYRGRFAPSPTGPLHFGSLVAAVASYADAHHAGGEWLLRIEDVDLPRAQPGGETAILTTLARYGFVVDAPIIRQSSRTTHYAAALQKLKAAQRVFPCACTRRELMLVPPGPLGEHVYPGTCRDAIPVDRSNRRQIAWRFKVDTQSVTFIDRLQGMQTQDLATAVGDFVVLRADGLFAYQLAVVVDDAMQGITHVVRGADLLSSTARQIALQRALDLVTPSYLHVPVALNARGEKLSKQTRARALPPDPMPALRAVWQFLAQAALPQSVASVRDFWSFAFSAWSVARLPPTRMLAAPSTG